MEKALDDFLISERQWSRVNRIANAKYNLSAAQADVERAFWTAVLKRLED